jgi:hypothetical protein
MFLPVQQSLSELKFERTAVPSEIGVSVLITVLNEPTDCHVCTVTCPDCSQLPRISTHLISQLPRVSNLLSSPTKTLKTATNRTKEKSTNQQNQKLNN